MVFTAFPILMLLTVPRVLHSLTTLKSIVSRPILSFSFALLDEM